jgi:hypothetical protein
VYTQIVDLAAVDNSRAIIAPGNSEDSESPFRSAGIDILAKGGTRPAPLARGKIEGLKVTKTTLAAVPYQGAQAREPLMELCEAPLRGT